MRLGLIDDINIGLYALKARWIDRREFEVSAEMQRSSLRLVLDLLEFHAKVYVNGVFLGEHMDAHRPARFEVSPFLHLGANKVVVVLESWRDRR